MPKSKAEFETLYPYQLYEPAEILERDLMYTIPEIARRLQGLDPEAELAPDAEERVIEWTIPWIIMYADKFVINDPAGDEPGYFGVAEHNDESEQTEGKSESDRRGGN
ncbi:MAG: hypothetical protein J07HQX50_01837 [Haloquadratum sp. J07HQX50]|jgi:hypothetical protein|nr:MAG: hypothetical protein J07HQX50_01837 [Haloquadratum sp. J07HQX50]